MDDSILSVWEELNSKTHTEQSVWFLNGFFHDLDSDQRELIWDICHLFVEVDSGQKKLYGRRQIEVKESCDVDELKAHVILEKLGETLTVRELRKRMKELDVDNNKRMSISEYLIAKYNKTPKQLVESPQGDGDEAELRKAQEKLQSANDALVEAVDALETSKKEAASLAEAEKDLAEAVKELETQEAEYQAKIKQQQDIIDSDAGVVKKNRAVNVLAQLKDEDPLPLRRAKITQGAALKRVTKQKKRSEEAVVRADAEREKAEKLVADAKEFLRAVQARGGGTAKGALWWMERSLKEAEKFMPQKRR